MKKAVVAIAVVLLVAGVLMYRAASMANCMDISEDNPLGMMGSVDALLLGEGLARDAAEEAEAANEFAGADDVRVYVGECEGSGREVIKVAAKADGKVVGLSLLTTCDPWSSRPVGERLADDLWRALERSIPKFIDDPMPGGASNAVMSNAEMASDTVTASWRKVVSLNYQEGESLLRDSD